MIIKVNKKRFFGFSNYTINLAFNTIASSFSFNALASEIDDLLNYPECEIIDEENGTLITGVILAPQLKSSTKPQLTTISGYSKTGALEDCSIPIDLFPLQSDNLTLSEITEKILTQFSLDFEINNVDTELSEKITKSNPEPGQKIKEYLTKLASQRGVIISNTVTGKLLYTRIDASKLKPVATFTVGSHGVKFMDLNINSQAMHSEITVMKQASSDNQDAGEKTISNPYVSAFRPVVIKLDSGTIFDAEKAARFELAKEISNIKLTFETTKFVRPGELILVRNSDLRINELTQFFVENTVIKGTEKENERYTLTCVLKDVYTNEEVRNVFE